MKTLKGSLFVAAMLVLLLAGADAQAQAFCGSCDPYGSCDVSCWYCDELVDPESGACPQWAYHETTCGQYSGACVPGNCTPNWQETARTTIGQYGETTYGVICSPWPYCYPTFGCEHHRVDRVTEEDVNECNTSSYYHQRQFCDDYVDFTLPHRTGSAPDCCSYPAYCNDWHSCW